MSPIEVLLVDDHRMVAEGMQHLLDAEADMAVVGVATTATQAVQEAQRLRPDVVLVDYHLPDGDGATVAADIRSQHPETLVIIVTGATDDRVLARAVEAGCAGLVTKDQPTSAIPTAIRAAVRGEPLLTADMVARILGLLPGGRPPTGTDLTGREIEVLHLMGQGRSTAAMAQDLFLSVNTVRNYVQSVLTKLGAHSRLEAVATARRHGLL